MSPESSDDALQKLKPVAIKPQQINFPPLSSPPDGDGKSQVSLERSGKSKKLFNAAIARLRTAFPLDSLINGRRGYVPTAAEGEELEALTSTRLNWLHVESLLDQAADLLDRALVTRQTIEDTQQQFFTLISDLHQYDD